ncbi:MAG: nucleotidyl transferase AbiEii/AbiGii toxin family protein [Clostridiales bacterium]|nr:nucleotidyl transferase AbiEii/AbiGii toxin family protein [Clostridiales bacterium]
MRVLYTKEYVERIAEREGFIKDNTEKVLRLIDALEYLNTQPEIKGKLALKGGTAINLTVVDFPRLSVDIDLDFAENLDKESVLQFRTNFKDIFSEFIDSGGYRLIEKSRTHYALDSFMLSYNGTSGNRDNIKVEINYLNRAHILPLEYRNINNRITDEPLSVLTLNPTEIYASKTVALLSRFAPRDIYDICIMIEKDTIKDIDLFRKCFVFYNVCGGKQDADNIDFSQLGNFTYDIIRRQLKPVLAKTDKFEIKHATERAEKYLREVLSLTNQEKEFVRLFREKTYKPTLLFDDEKIVKRIETHPMILWRLR